MSVFQVLLDLLYPPKCPFCGRVLNRGEDGMCALCQESLPWTEGEGKPVDGCEICLSPVWYADGVPVAIHRYKFNGGRTHAKLFGTLMAQCLNDRWHRPMDLVTWVPLSAKRLKERGYDQAELLARQVAKLADLPVVSTLEKIRQTQTQSRLEESARKANVHGAYRALPEADLVGKRVLLIDDVVTSGATLSECAFCLCAAGTQSVAALTFARSR